jgi:hypothetical protein
LVARLPLMTAAKKAQTNPVGLLRGISISA